jgi:hypothetical protein
MAVLFLRYQSHLLIFIIKHQFLILSNIQNYNYSTSLRENSDLDILSRNILYISESLMKVIYNLEGKDFLSDETEAVNKFFLSQIQEFMTQNSRFPTHITRGSTTLKQLEEVN